MPTEPKNYHPHALLEFGGTLNELSGTPEIWACGIRVVSANTQGALPVGDIEGYLDALVDGDHSSGTTLLEWFGDATNHMANNAFLRYVKLNNIGVDGTYSEPGITHVRDVTPTPGGSGPSAPSFCSVAMTWETGLTRGRAHRGRIYPPNYTYSAGGSMINDSDRASVVAAGVALINLINDAHNDDEGSDELNAFVMSGLDASHHVITGVSADNVWDVQRRRKNQVQGTRSAISPVTIP